MTEFRYRKLQQNLSWSPFFLAITTPHAHGDLDGSIILYSSRVSVYFLHASDLLGVVRLAPSLCGSAEFSSSISCSTKLQHPMSGLFFEKSPRFDLVDGFKLFVSHLTRQVLYLLLNLLVLVFTEISNSSKVHRLSLT